MKVRVKQSLLGFQGLQPYIAFTVSGEERDRLQNWHGKDLNGYVIDIYKPKRSNEANAYMWQLIGEIADRSGVSSRDVYRQSVREAGKYEDLLMKADGLKTFTESWESNGIAWIVEHDPPGDIYVNVRAYYGSSAYNSKEFSRLVDYVVAEAKFWGIETIPPDELERMKAGAR